MDYTLISKLRIMLVGKPCIVPPYMSANRCGIYEATLMRLWTQDHSDRGFVVRLMPVLQKKVLYMFERVKIDG